VRTAQDLAEAKAEMAQNASARIAASDLQESGASIRDPDTRVVSLEKRYAELVLQLAHTATDRRLPDTQNGRNASKAEMLPDEKCLTYRDQRKIGRCHPLFAP
jgi:hypothetical protein